MLLLEEPFEGGHYWWSTVIGQGDICRLFNGSCLGINQGFCFGMGHLSVESPI